MVLVEPPSSISAKLVGTSSTSDTPNQWDCENSSSAMPNAADATTGITVQNNIIRDGGHVFPGAVGILVGHSDGNNIAFNEVAGFRGMPLPERLRPAPLNLIVRRLAGAPSPTDIARFEFLDFDAY